MWNLCLILDVVVFGLLKIFREEKLLFFREIAYDSGALIKIGSIEFCNSGHTIASLERLEKKSDSFYGEKS